jgi:hypothetical protein
MHPFCHPQSKVEKLSSTTNYHVMFMNGPNEKRSCGYNAGFTDYEAVLEMVINSLSAAFPENMVASVVPKSGALIVALACVEASGDIRLLSICISVWNESEIEHEVLCGLTLPSLPISSKSSKKFCLPDTQATEFRLNGMFLAVLHSLQVWIAYQTDYENRPLDHMWTMTVPCPRRLVPYFADHGFFPDKSRSLDENTFWMKIEAPMRVSAREAGEMTSPANTRNDRFCFKRITLQKLGVIAWRHDPQDTTMSVHLVCIQRSSLFNRKVRDNIDGDFKHHYFVRFDFCNRTSEPHGIIHFLIYFVEWMSTHILECHETTQRTK